MRRLLRILLNAATVLSLVLCVVTMAAWVRSYLARDLVYWAWETRAELRVFTYRGGLSASVFTRVDPDDFFSPGAVWKKTAPTNYGDPMSSQGTFFNRFGFELLDSRDAQFAMRSLACPYWFILLLTAILPGARLAGWRRRRARRLRMRPGLCRHCGYDCRATPDRCPECGRGVAG